MKADLLTRLFKATFAEDIYAVKKIAHTIIEDEKKNGHKRLAESLILIANSEKPRAIKPISYSQRTKSSLQLLPSSKRTNSPLVSLISRDRLKHHMILPPNIEKRLLSIEGEYAARERLGKYNLAPKKKILIHGPSGCGKTLSAERLAWNLGLPLLKVRFDSLISSYFGESASNLREVFEYCKNEPVVLLLDECDFIAKSRIINQDVGEVPRIVNMLLTLLDEYSAPGLVIATTNLKITLDEALFRRFDDILAIPSPGLLEREKLFEMTLSAIPISPSVCFSSLAHRTEGYSAADIVLLAQRAAKIGILEGNRAIAKNHFDLAFEESTKI